MKHDNNKLAKNPPMQGLISNEKSHRCNDLCEGVEVLLERDPIKKAGLVLPIAVQLVSACTGSFCVSTKLWYLNAEFICP